MRRRGANTILTAQARTFDTPAVVAVLKPVLQVGVFDRTPHRGDFNICVHLQPF